MMRTFYKGNSFLLVTLLLLSATIISCRKDSLSSRELLIFLQGDKAGTATGTITMPLVHSPVTIYGNKTVEVSAYASREVEADIDVSIYPDPALANITAYNQKNGTSHLLLPSNTYKVLNGSKFRIASGTLKSLPMQIEITDASALTNASGYLLPIWISGIETKDKGAAISTTHRMVYIKVTYEFNNVKITEVPLTGTLMSRTGWTVTVSNSSSGTANQASNLLDGNNATVWRSSNSSTAAKTITLNMGIAQQVSGFRLSPNYTNTNENPVEIVLSSSPDNTTWTIQGTWRGTPPLAGSDATNPDFKGINLDAPVTARYWRFDITRRVTSSVNVAGVAEVNAVQ